jgi:RimJ/RimL family protein N-acetyltransferase
MRAHEPRQLGSEVSLRPVTPADLEFMFQIGLDPESNAMAGTKPRTREAFFEAWAQHIKNPAIHTRVIVHGGELAGSISCFQVGEENHVGYWLAREHWGKGVASLAVKMFLEVELRRPLRATVARANVASTRVLAKCGFRCVGYRQGEETERYSAREVGDFVLD